MKDIPFEAAKEFCEKYEKDQCVILSWDEKTLSTWVTTFGKGDKNSIQAANSGAALKDFLKLKREHEEIPERFKKWQMESVDRYYYWCGRNHKRYMETTFWFEVHTMERKETKRFFDIACGEEGRLPLWAKSITEYREQLNADYN